MYNYIEYLFSLISVGQCGNQIGSAFWPLALHEYGIQTTNTGTNLLRTQENHTKAIGDLPDAFHSFFSTPDNAHGLCFETVGDLRRANVKARVYHLLTIYDSSITRRRFITGNVNNFMSHRQY